MKVELIRTGVWDIRDRMEVLAPMNNEPVDLPVPLYDRLNRMVKTQSKILDYSMKWAFANE